MTGRTLVHGSFRVLIALLTLVVLHWLALLVVQGPLFLSFGKKCAIGSNGLALRFACGKNGVDALGFGVLGNSLKFEANAAGIFVQLPIPETFLVLLLATMLIWIRQKMKKRRAGIESGG